jgi:hypothetical protein
MLPDGWSIAVTATIVAGESPNSGVSRLAAHQNEHWALNSSMLCTVGLLVLRSA